MMKKNKILAVSFIAMLAVSSAHATIVTQENIVGANGVSVTVPTSGTNKGKVQVSGPDLSGKENVLTFTTSGSGNVVTGVSKSGSTVTVTKGTTLGSLATKSAVASGDITDGTIVNADISGSAAITTNKMGAITGYAKATTNEALATTDTLNTALGKLEKKADDAATAAANAKNNVTASGSNGVTASASNGAITVTGVNADASNKGVMKLYTGTGTNTDGTMTQNAINTALNGKQDDLTVMSVSEGTTGTATTERSMDAAKLKQIVQGTNASSNPVNGLAANAYLTGYAKGTSSAAVATTDTIKTAIGKLENQIAGKQAALTIDTAMSSTSTNPVQNKVVNTALGGKVDKTQSTKGGILTTNASSGAVEVSTTIASSKVSGLGSLATKSAVASGDITDGTIVNADISDNAAIAVSKISGAQTVANIEANTSEYSVDSTTKYPSMAVAQDMIEKGTSTINTNITNLTNNKQNKIAAGTAGNVVTYSGTAGTVGSLGFDTAPTANSTNLVKSGAIKTALDTKQNKSTANYQMGNSSGSWTTMTTQQQNMLNGKIPVGSETATTNTTYASIWVE